MSTPYVGRFAPSPTGQLHAGSLYAALASYLDARAHKGLWLVRIEDIDTPRTIAGASDAILDSLSAHGLIPDQPVIYQSERITLYETILANLLQQNRCFYCTCSRKDLAGIAHYSGTCRQQDKPRPLSAIRIHVPNHGFQHFVDRVQGLQSPPQLDQNTVFDFVIKRKDSFFAYQFACVVDDIDQGVTHVVRGIDIVESTFKQQFLYQTLNKQAPSYLHLPVIINAAGQKLSKQNLAQPIDNNQAKRNLIQALTALNQPIPHATNNLSINALLDLAIRHWQPARIQAITRISESIENVP